MSRTSHMQLVEACVNRQALGGASSGPCVMQAKVVGYLKHSWPPWTVDTWSDRGQSGFGPQDAGMPTKRPKLEA